MILPTNTTVLKGT